MADRVAADRTEALLQTVSREATVAATLVEAVATVAHLTDTEAATEA